ncbi:MAG: hypothetical protein WCR42_09970 [bacterium]
MKKITVVYVALVFAVLAITSCQFLKDVATTVNNLQRLKYKINNVNNFTMGGMDISNKKTVSDFSVTDGLKLAMALKSGQLPTTFTINVDAMNPNDGTNSTIQTAATISSLPWDLYIDNKLIVSGNISKEISVPGTGKSVTIPLQVNVDLVQLYKNEGVDKIMNVALALGGKNKSAANIKIITQPSVRTAIGVIQYPSKITIVDKSWSE